MDKDKDSTNQNLKHPSIQTYVNTVETQDTDQDSTVLHPVSVQEMSQIWRFHQQLPHKTTEHKCEHY